MNAATIIKAMQGEFNGGSVLSPDKAFVYDSKIENHIIFMWENSIEDDDVKDKLKSLNCQVELFGNGYAVIAV